jgi:hypothetical protein
MLYSAISFIITLILLLIGLLSGCEVNGGGSGSSGSSGISGEVSSEVSGGRSIDKYQSRAISKYGRAKKKKIPFDKFCNRTEFKIQPQQEFASDYVAGGKSILVFHRIGAGKTCLSIQCGLKRLKHGKPMYVMPASLIPGFYSELETCGDLDPDRVNVYSYNKFNEGKLPRASVLIIDEVQNISKKESVTYKKAMSYITKYPDTPVVLMSATPVFDKPEELVCIARLLRLEIPDALPSPAELRRIFAGSVSYYAGAPDYVYPEVNIKLQKCVMSAFQSRWYKADVAAEIGARGIKLSPAQNDFYINSRQRSNIVYPHGLKDGLDELTPSSTYSAKFSMLAGRLSRGGLSFVYSSFTGAGGIAAICKYLDSAGFSDYAKSGSGRKRYVVWSGDQSLSEKDEIRKVFNSTENDNGSRIQVVVGSPSIKEGVSLLRVRKVHVMEAYWNHSRLEQIYGRAVRYCSHKSLPEDRRKVTIYIYCADTGDKKLAKTDPMRSIDYYMLSIADEKRIEAKPYVDALIDTAVDRYIY